jgi:hypothetical protein
LRIRGLLGMNVFFKIEKSDYKPGRQQRQENTQCRDFDPPAELFFLFRDC